MGGTAPYTYSWINVSTGENAGATEQITVSPAETTNYTVTVADDFIPTAGDDPSADATGTVTVIPALSVSVNSESINQGQSATLTAVPVGGTAPYTYSWINVSTGENAGATEQITVNPAETTNYTVTVADSFAPTTGDDPSAEATGTVTVIPALSVSVNSESINQGQSATLTAVPGGRHSPTSPGLM